MTHPAVYNKPMPGLWEPIDPILHWRRAHEMFHAPFDEATHLARNATRRTRAFIPGSPNDGTIDMGPTPQGRALRVRNTNSAVTFGRGIEWGSGDAHFDGTVTRYALAMTLRWDPLRNEDRRRRIVNFEGAPGLTIDFNPFINRFIIGHGIGESYNANLSAASGTRLRAELVPLVFTRSVLGIVATYFSGRLVGFSVKTRPLVFSGNAARLAGGGNKSNICGSFDMGMLHFSNVDWIQGRALDWTRDPFGHYRGMADLPPIITPPAPFFPYRTPGETAIANAALVCLGERLIGHLLEESRAARILEDRFDAVRDEVLRMVPWSFAMQRADLAASAAPPGWGFARAFPLPYDCIKLQAVNNPNNLPYRVEGREILTSQPAPLSILYTSRVTDTTRMDPLFKQVFAASLAVDVAESITGDSSKLAHCFGEMARFLEEAARVNGQEQDVRRFGPGRWELGRGREERER